MDLIFILKISGILILLGLSAFFSGSETAFFSLRRWKVERLKTSGKGGFHVSELFSDPRGLLFTFIISNEIVNVTASNLAAMIRRDYFSHLGAFGVAAAMIIMTATLFLFGEITPKSIAVYIPERWSTLASFPMRVIYSWFAPIRKFLKKITERFDILFFKGAKMEPQGMTISELRSLIKESLGESGLSIEEAKIIDSIFDLSTILVKTVMVPRTQIVFMQEDMNLREALLLAGKTKFSRFPVMGKNTDDVKGIIYSKDLLSAFFKLREASHVKDILKPAYFVPETKQAYELLRDFQVRKIHIAIVLDEYGGTAGLITLDDLLSEVVGEIIDRYRPSAYRFKKISENVFIIDGNLSLQDFNELSGTALEDPDIETMAGYVIKLLGHIPHIGDEVQDLNFEFRVLNMIDKRVTEIQARRIEPTPEL